MIQIENDTSFFILWEGVLMHTHARCSSKLSFHTIIGQQYLIVTRFSYFRIVAETRTISVFRMILCSRIKLYFTSSRHNQDIAQIGMSCSTHMCMTETNNCIITMLISSTISIYTMLITSINIMRDSICIRTELNKPERNTSSRERMPHTIGSNNRIDLFHLSKSSHRKRH